MIILAAGEGKRLRPYTEDRPKCKVEVGGKPIIEWILNAAESSDISDVRLITGYKKEKLESYGYPTYFNSQYAQTNMLFSFLCAREDFNDDILLSYSDIVYEASVLKQLKDSKEDITIVADLEWYKLWKMRMENPLDDAESFKVNQEGNIVDIGRKEKSIKNIQAQYMGLLKFSKKAIAEVMTVIEELEKTPEGSNKIKNMFFTDFLQILISRNFKLKPLFIKGGWFEVDTVEDLHIYNKNLSSLIKG